MRHVTSLEKRARICTLLDEGHTIRAIASIENVHNSTVSRIGKRWRETGSYYDRLRCGRPGIFTERNERNIIRHILSGKCHTAVDIQTHLRTEEGVVISAQTIRNVLKRNGLEARVKRKKPLLQRKHRQQRLRFAKKYKDWTVEDWKKVVWSDESKFMIFGSDGRQYCWRRIGQQLGKEQIKPTVKHGGGSIMVWGCFTSQGVGYLCRINEGLDGNLYREILDEEFKNTLLWYNLSVKDIVFQQDNDPKHTAKQTKQWFADNNISVLDWPSQSPDLNPIEHLWNEVERRLHKSQDKTSSKEGLWIKLEEIWNNIEVQFCTKLIETMPDRVRDVYKAKGGYTRW